jgi:hypothetical protein
MVADGYLRRKQGKRDVGQKGQEMAASVYNSQKGKDAVWEKIRG